MLCFLIQVLVFFSVGTYAYITHLKNRSAMFTCGLMLSLSVVFKCQYLGAELLQVRR